MDYAGVQGCLAILGTGLAAWTDYRTGLIHNRLTLSVLVVGLVLSLLFGGWWGLGLSVAGALAAALVPLLMFRVNGIGGGDVKLLAALGALLGLQAALEIQGLAFGIGAASGLFIWWRQGALRRGLAATALLIVPKSLRLFRKCEKEAEVKTTAIRFGPAIFVATLVVVVLRFVGTVS